MIWMNELDEGSGRHISTSSGSASSPTNPDTDREAHFFPRSGGRRVARARVGSGHCQSNTLSSPGKPFGPKKTPRGLRGRK